MSSQFAFADGPTGILLPMMNLPGIYTVESAPRRQFFADDTRRNAHERANFQCGPMAFCITRQTAQFHLIRLAEGLDQSERMQRIHQARPAVEFGKRLKHFVGSVGVRSVEAPKCFNRSEEH